MKVSLFMASFLPGNCLRHAASPTERGPYRVPYHRSHRPRDGSVASSLHGMNDPQPEGHMASNVERRKFLVTLGGAAAWPLAARAQQGDQTRRVGVLTAFAENDRDAQAYMTAFRQALEKLGWAVGRNLRIDYRWGGAEPERIRTYAIELVGLKPDVILAVTAQALQPLQQ